MGDRAGSDYRQYSWCGGWCWVDDGGASGGERTTSLTIEIEPRWVLIALAVGLVGGSIGALYPALRAARQDAVEALSYE